MTREERGALLLIGYGAVGVVLLYVIAERIVLWIRNGSEAGEPR